MKNYNQIEVILFSNYSCSNISQKDLVRWLGTTAQSAIKRQYEKTQKIWLTSLKDTPAIYLS